MTNRWSPGTGGWLDYANAFLEHTKIKIERMIWRAKVAYSGFEVTYWYLLYKETLPGARFSSGSLSNGCADQERSASHCCHCRIANLHCLRWLALMHTGYHCSQIGTPDFVCVRNFILLRSPPQRRPTSSRRAVRDKGASKATRNHSLGHSRTKDRRG